VRAGYEECLLFEIGKTHNKKTHLDDDEGLPGEPEVIEGVYVSRNAREGAAYYRVRRVIDQLAADLGIDIVYSAIDNMPDTPVNAPFDAKRSAFIHTPAGIFIGIVGELRQTVRTSFKLPDYAAAFSLDSGALLNAFEVFNQLSRYKRLSKYPSISQDISLKTSAATSYADIYHALAGQLSTASIDIALTPGVIYQPDDDTTTKTTTFHVQCVSDERTLTDDDIRPIIEKMVEAARTSVGATLV
jgi:phenylalanyl-tRNA synthetase beta chain